MTLHEWMGATGKTGRWCAEKLDIEEAHLSRIRNRLVEPSLHLANRIVALSKGMVTPRELERARK